MNMYWPNAIILDDFGNTWRQSTYDSMDLTTAFEQLCIWIKDYDGFKVVYHWIEDEEGNIIYKEEREE